MAPVGREGYSDYVAVPGNLASLGVTRSRCVGSDGELSVAGARNADYGASLGLAPAVGFLNRRALHPVLTRASPPVHREYRMRSKSARHGSVHGGNQ